MRKESLKYILTENTTRKFPATVPRQMELPLDTLKITTLVGIPTPAQRDGLHC
jgi:hypothetical protein